MAGTLSGLFFRNELKRGLLLCAALLLPFAFSACGKAPGGGKTLRVLFIGNSLTYVNDLPGLLAQLAKSRDSKMEYEMYAPGGYTLAGHSADPQLLAKINKGAWDIVVLQEQSQLPAYPWAETQVFPYAQKLSQLARTASPGVKIAFYMTMAKRNGDTQNLRDFPSMGTYDGMQQKLNTAYSRMAAENRGILVPVGPVWQKVRSHEPSLELYADDTHPNLTGSYLAACVFYAVLFGDTPAGLTHPPQLSDDTAAMLQREAADGAAAPGP